MNCRLLLNICLNICVFSGTLIVTNLQQSGQRGSECLEWWNHQTSSSQTPAAHKKQPQRKVTLHPLLSGILSEWSHIWGMYNNTWFILSYTLTSHCRLLFESFPPESSTIFLISSRSFSAWLLASSLLSLLHKHCKHWCNSEYTGASQ